ncbi:MAG: biotin/lipoyl-binding protein [Chloroflexi bacterium]|nr:biotin/lipoyl-binding protein [Chloroflexota bacterium]MBI4316032.1 biotin/lipoyl-binding protein [Chloroflexota bacterium]
MGITTFKCGAIAPHAGKVKRVLVTVGDVVERGQKLVELGH